MKFLEVVQLQKLSLLLSPSGSNTYTTLELYSCTAGADKKLYKSLDTFYTQKHSQHEVSSSPLLSPHSSFLSLSSSSAASSSSSSSSSSSRAALSASGKRTLIEQPGSRKALIFFIAILNASFPDYDFSYIEPDEFRAEPSIYTCASSVNALLGSLVPGYADMKDHVWRTLDEQIHLKETEVYEFVPTLDSDPFRDVGASLHLSYFFYNARTQRVLFWNCHSKRRRDRSLSVGPAGKFLSRSTPSPYPRLSSSVGSDSFGSFGATAGSAVDDDDDDDSGFYSNPDSDSSDPDHLYDDHGSDDDDHRRPSSNSFMMDF